MAVPLKLTLMLVVPNGGFVPMVGWSLIGCSLECFGLLCFRDGQGIGHHRRDHGNPAEDAGR
jgi:hypothetical protein